MKSDDICGSCRSAGFNPKLSREHITNTLTFLFSFDSFVNILRFFTKKKKKRRSSSSSQAFERVAKYHQKICKNSRAALSCALPGNPLKPDKFRGIWETNATLDQPRCAYAASGTAAETAAPALTSKSRFGGRQQEHEATSLQIGFVLLCKGGQLVKDCLTTSAATLKKSEIYVHQLIVSFKTP